MNERLHIVFEQVNYKLKPDYEKWLEKMRKPKKKKVIFNAKGKL